MAHTVVEIPVVEFDSVVRRQVLGINPEVTVAEGTVCAHVTLLGPFVDRQDVDADLMSTLRAIVAPVSRFAFELTAVERFASGLVYLVPEPEEPFQQLTKMLWSAFPAWPPYGGAFDEVVPHVSVGHDLSQPEIADLRESLPIATTASQIALTWWAADAVETLALFPLDE